ncbi:MULTISPECIES: hypothetical protein [Stenotrophomonas]|uniref:hypothetical protein n=1 Tax=Stenotrophomonas maltophilia group TaxID=995085 RepID=UPI002DBF9B3D|nr:hypothetical protein [Stenotrophomonas pavanii]MEC4339714.1 hypothetical protein [Stenotrophomonas pavanii]
MSEFHVGQEVGAGRWPFAGEYPGNWGIPWKGLVLDPANPQAWANTGAFPTENPDPEQVRLHLSRVGSTDRVPVLWDFGGSRVAYWELKSALRPYADDLAAWEQARRNAMKNSSISSTAALAA